MSISAEQFSKEGDKYLGKLYSEMDCQEFYERCAEDAGLKKDLKGSNAWYREFLKNGWTGSPEECKKKFGSIPKGATLFIHAYDGGEEKRGYHDGLGNASHIGIKTGRSGASMAQATGKTEFAFGDGAIHSSSKKKHVVTSNFKDKTIPNGGWNMVGLHPWFSYGEKIDWILGGQAGQEEAKEDKMEPYIVTAANGGDVHVREGAGKRAKQLFDLPSGTEVQAEESETAGWMRIQTASGKTGYMMSEFLKRAEAETVLVALPYDAALALRDALISQMGVG